MEAPAHSPVRPVALRLAERLGAALLLCCLTAGQGWMTLQLFGADAPWERLLDDEPIVSGRHPLHLYHGFLSSRSLFERGTPCCYDPAFQAGYPRTPVFDGGSRPAELFLAAGGGAYRPSAYKVGLALCCLAIPLLLYLAGANFGLGPLWSCLASAVGLLAWWGPLGRALLEAGDLDVLLASIAALVHVSFLFRFHAAPGLGGWLGLLGSAALGWWSIPPLFAVIVAPALLVYYFTAGIRHGLGWHLALLGSLAGGLGANWFWLMDWLHYWWLRVPLTADGPSPGQLLETLGGIAFWGNPASRGLALAVFSLGIVGLAAWHLTRQRSAAQLLCLALAGLAAGTACWEPLRRVGAERLVLPALWLAGLPAVFLCQLAFQGLSHCSGAAWRAALLVVGVVGAGAYAAWPGLVELAQEYATSSPLVIGLDADRQAMVEAIRQYADRQGRVLWEDQPGPPTAPRWTPLLPLLTERIFVGGLDPDGSFEHALTGFVDGRLSGKPIGDWTDVELREFCRRYNLGWVACWSPAAVARLEEWCRQGEAERTAPLQESGQTGWLFTLRRDRSFVLQGQARWLSADCRRIALADLVPDSNGTVVLSLHYQTGLHASSPRVHVERDPDSRDPIPFVRLRLDEPMTLVALTWEP